MSVQDVDAGPGSLAQTTLLPDFAPAGDGSALPRAWERMWGHPEDPAPLVWHRIQRLSRELAEALPLRDERATFASLVGSDELRSQPLHRWFSYKEAYSPALLGAVIDELGLERDVRVLDTFGGVGTTALAGQVHPAVVEVRSVEYSPFAHFVGTTKLRWHELDPERLRSLLPQAVAYSVDPQAPVPGLAAFDNTRIFHPLTVRSLVSAREHVRRLPGARPEERDFLLLGLAAVVEDLSNAMKDGRALRIKAGRKRRASSLAAHASTVPTSGRVKRALAGQWSAMIEDLVRCANVRGVAAATSTWHLRGDARSLGAITDADGVPAIPERWADLGCFSPPYLNFIDYTEVHKLELWMLEHVKTQQEFKQTRLGTLRSHPSVRFPERGYLDGADAPVVELVRLVADWMSAYGARREVGPVVMQYFEDMFQVWREQHRSIRDGGAAVCVVANSTFSRRDRDGLDMTERWRLPVLTDVMLGHLAKEAGFAHVEIWEARELRPRNVRGGEARESLVVARKA